MKKFLKSALLIFILMVSDHSIATIEVIGSLTFKYIDESGKEVIKNIIGYTLESDLSDFITISALNISVGRSHPEYGGQFSGQCIITIHCINLFFNGVKKIGFLVILDDNQLLFVINTEREIKKYSPIKTAASFPPHHEAASIGENLIFYGGGTMQTHQSSFLYTQKIEIPLVVLLENFTVNDRGRINLLGQIMEYEIIESHDVVTAHF